MLINKEQSSVSVFYDYLLKFWLYKNKSDKMALQNYLNALRFAERKLISPGIDQLLYLSDNDKGSLGTTIKQSTCFAGGLLALTVKEVTFSISEKIEYETAAKYITRTCYESYARQPTHLGPESFKIAKGNQIETLNNKYVLRPQTIESYFYMWKTTNNSIYRDYAWDATESIEKFCKTENGYVGLNDVRSINTQNLDRQPSYFLSGTLKYLYLIFTDYDNLFDLNRFVLNAGAHLFKRITQ